MTHTLQIIILLLLFVGLMYLKENIDTFVNNCDKNIEDFKVSQEETECENEIECYLCQTEGRTDCEGCDKSQSNPRKSKNCQKAVKSNPYIFHSLGHNPHKIYDTLDKQKSITFPKKKTFTYVNIKDFKKKKMDSNKTIKVPNSSEPNPEHIAKSEYKKDLEKLENKILKIIENTKTKTDQKVKSTPDMSKYIKKSEVKKCRENNSKYILKSKIKGRLNVPDPTKYVLKTKIKPCREFGQQFSYNSELDKYYKDSTEYTHNTGSENNLRTVIDY